MLPVIGVAGAMLWRGCMGALSVAVLAGFRGLWPRRPGLLFGRSAMHCVVSVIWYFVWMSGFGLADSYAVAAASLGQVHKAVLPGGDVVAVKLQYPDYRSGLAAILAAEAEDSAPPAGN